MAERLNGMMGVPQAERIGAGRVSSRSAGECGIPFIDTHFPSQRLEVMRRAREALGELAESLQGGTQDMPRVEVRIDEDAHGYVVSMTCSGADVSEQVGLTLKDGVLLVALAARGDDSDASAQNASAQILVPVPLPADAGSEIETVAHGDESLTVRVAKGARAADESMGDDADEDEQGKEALARLAQALRAFGLDIDG